MPISSHAKISTVPYQMDVLEPIEQRLVEVQLWPVGSIHFSFQIEHLVIGQTGPIVLFALTQSISELDNPCLPHILAYV